MRSFAFLGLAVASSAAARVRLSESWRDVEWSYRPDPLGSWYRDHGVPLPELAAPITTVVDQQSYVVKLECVACPFRVREYGQLVETWQTPPQDNSLLLNFTINNHGAASSLLLNGQRITPIALPLHISTFQVPANLSAEIMGKMTSMHMLDRSWRVGTKYGEFELQYEHAMLATAKANEEWVQFDITAIHMRQQSNPGSASLDQDGQKMIQLLLSRTITEGEPTLRIKDIQLVQRRDRELPVKMPCGKDAIIKTEFDPLEWDYYGKFGTWSRTLHLALGKIGRFFDENGLVLILFGTLFSVTGLVRWFLQRSKVKATARVKEDAEAAGLLASEHDDVPPAYLHVPELLEPFGDRKEETKA